MSLKVISEIYHNNSVRDRRNLRSSIEERRLQLADSVLNDINNFKHNLDDLSSELEAMLTSCKTINSKLQQKMAASAFIKSFYISPEDWSLLNEPPSQAVSEHVLQLLQRARTTQRLFETSIRYPTTVLAKDIMEVTACFVDKAFEQIYNWVKREVSAQCFEAIEISVALRKYVLDEYANARRKVIAEAFINALTVGWTSGPGFEPVATKPMELQSHDPLRYAGDMLAWLHQATASEREYFKSLTSDKVDTELMQDCLNNITNGLAYPLQLRLEQLLVTEHSAVLLYKINNVLQFYSSVIMNLLGEKCTVYTTLSELQSLSWNLFISALQQETSNLLTESEFPRHDFLPSVSALEVCRLLEAILTCQDMSYAAPDVRQTKCEQTAFNGFLARPDSLDLPELQSIAYPRPRNTLRKRVADQLHTAYTKIYAALTDPANGYGSIDMALKTPQEVAELILNA
nr:unnamed protein product [Spirometra erinaceieuropaei]